MYLEAVTVCVDYSTELREAIIYNRVHLDRWLIVTTPEDTATRSLCHAFNLECITTRDFYRNDAKFDKARGVDRGLQALAYKDWVMHLDADIVLPGSFRESLENADLDRECIYGCDRFMVRGWDKWGKLKESDFLDRYARSAHHNVCFPEGYPVGARWADIHQGYVPVGFAQIFHATAVMYNGIRYRRYPAYGHSDASRTDVQYGLLWDRQHRKLLPEVVVAHLEPVAGAGAKTGANWSGRKTPPFTPNNCKPPVS